MHYTNTSMHFVVAIYLSLGKMHSVDLNGRTGVIYQEINNLHKESGRRPFLSITSTYVLMATTYDHFCVNTCFIICNIEIF